MIQSMLLNCLPASAQKIFVVGLIVLLAPFVEHQSIVKGQQLFVEGGSAHLAPEQSTEAATWIPSYWVGFRTFQAGMFQLEASVGYNDAALANGEVAVRPWYGRSRIDPYVFLGYGRYYDNDRSTLVSSGVGAELDIGQGLGVFVEIDKSWSSFNTNTARNTLSGWGTAVGLSYSLNQLGAFQGSPSPRPDRGSPPQAANEETNANQPQTVASANSQATPDTADRGHPARFGSTVVDPNKYPEMSFVSDGVFTMGLTDEDPLALQTAGIKRITVNALFVDKHEVTNEEYREYLQSLSGSEREEMLPDSSVWTDVRTREGWTAYFRSEPFDDFPVLGVDWEQATAYCEANDKRLPTEAEWEYAARAGHTGRIYSWQGHDPLGVDGNYRANYNPGRPGYAADGYAFTAPVDAFAANDWGFFNMSGNVAEWVMDAYTPTFDEISDFNPLYRDSSEVRRVVRGGSWASDAFYVGVGVRDAQPLDEASPYVGFRCARDVGTSLRREPEVAADSTEAAADSTQAAVPNEQ